MLYRQVNLIYQDDYNHLIKSGLYEKLTQDGLLVHHEELNEREGFGADCFKIIKPDLVSFVSYPYEWSFSQLKDAALTTLMIQRTCLDYGMSLKDASAYNIQFLDGKPVFIDTLSFEIYKQDSPWIAYKQFCQHFLAPLALMSQTDIRLNQLTKNFIDGIPLDLTVTLLPKKTKFNISLLMHLHLHAKAQMKYESQGKVTKNVQLKPANLYAIIDSLVGAVNKLQLRPQSTEWGDYYTKTNYTEESFLAKKEIVAGYLEQITAEYLWDLGANTGVFTRIASQLGINCIAFDIDPLAVEYNYLMVKNEQEPNLLPLVLDLTNPSPSIGWNNEERFSLQERVLPDTVMALALIHHLAISNNLPLKKIASFFNDICNYLIIEFVPKSDSQVKKLLESRVDVFNEYDQNHFEEALGEYFDIAAKKQIIDSERTIYLMKKKF